MYCLIGCVATPVPRRPGPGRPANPVKVVPAEVCYAMVRKQREKGHVVEVVRAIIFGNFTCWEYGWIVRWRARRSIPRPSSGIWDGLASKLQKAA